MHFTPSKLWQNFSALSPHPSLSKKALVSHLVENKCYIVVAAQDLEGDAWSPLAETDPITYCFHITSMVSHISGALPRLVERLLLPSNLAEPA